MLDPARGSRDEEESSPWQSTRDLLLSPDNGSDDGALSVTTRLDPSMAMHDRRTLMLMSIRDDTHRAPLGREIFDAIAIDFVEGKLRPGATLNSVDLAARFGTSRTPVREALADLERQGIIVIPPRRRPYVPMQTTKQMKDVYDLRAALFTLVSELIVSDCPVERIAELKPWQEALEDDTARGAANDYFWHNVGFRLCEIRLAGNEELQRVLGSIGLRTLHFRHESLSQPGRLEHSLALHQELINAYENRDRDKAIAATQKLIRGGYAALHRSGLYEDTDANETEKPTER